jgi:hypothetical protein
MQRTLNSDKTYMQEKEEQLIKGQCEDKNVLYRIRWTTPKGRDRKWFFSIF